MFIFHKKNEEIKMNTQLVCLWKLFMLAVSSLFLIFVDNHSFKCNNIIIVMFKGQELISEYAISFHYILPDELYVLDFFVYHLRVYGRTSGLKQLNWIRLSCLRYEEFLH